MPASALHRLGKPVAHAIAVLIIAVGLLTIVMGVRASGASQPQRRQLASATLSRFRVVVTATRGPGQPAMATVTATGYQRSGSQWKLIATKRIGDANQWYWASVDACSLTIRQLAGASPAQAVDSARISLLPTPAIGCIPTFSERWTP
jgi:hypothetical protein